MATATVEVEEEPSFKLNSSNESPRYLDEYSRTPSLTSDDTETSLSQLSISSEHNDNSVNPYRSPSLRKDGLEPTTEIEIDNAVGIRIPPAVNLRKMEKSSASLNMKRNSKLKQRASPLKARSVADLVFDDRILSSLLARLSWTSFANLVNTSKKLRSLFVDPVLKDTVLRRFVPGYAFVSSKDTSQDMVSCTFTDLSHLMVALSLPLHNYPAHALSVLSTYNQEPHSMATTTRLQTLSLAYSLFVSILRHKSMMLPFQEEWLERPPRQIKRRPSRMKELTFPAPLSYFGKPEMVMDDILGPLPSSLSGGRREASNSSSASGHSYASSILSRTSTITSVSSTSASHRTLSKSPSSAPVAKRERRASIFRGSSKRVPPPAPKSAPSSMQFYTNGASSGWRKRPPPVKSDSGALSEDEYPLVAPTRPWHRKAGSSASHHSPSESVSSLPSSRPSSSSRLGGVERIRAPRYIGPHDLASATVRTRAPLLRVFVPCTRLTPGVMQEVENQLKQGGLWEYVYVGDVICNLGYVGEGRRGLGNGEWLVLKGTPEGLIVVPLESSSVSNPLPTYYTLPSPFYYSPFLPHEDPIISLALIFPSQPQYTPLTLAHSTHSTTHALRVKKYTWITTVYVDSPPAHLGDGWKGDWVLEGEGTREGRACLERVLMGGGAEEFVWEVIGERCTETLIWMRLLTQPQSRHELADAVHRL